jgi:hypothetical protein
LPEGYTQLCETPRDFLVQTETKRQH